ncbi:hypothetical protein SPHINGO8BC_60387 [Sphingobacterium multivorum]|uniref:Uncharacterized protein n=1 Tax=Sphingobacterium multivorum TaxID=28454 RepID=A0A654DI96_SPHMU|nr:hypothetical protein SPHINGO8BC_60387 [Sphingobacterium multivorum]
MILRKKYVLMTLKQLNYCREGIAVHGNIRNKNIKRQIPANGKNAPVKICHAYGQTWHLSIYRTFLT